MDIGRRVCFRSCKHNLSLCCRSTFRFDRKFIQNEYGNSNLHGKFVSTSEIRFADNKFVDVIIVTVTGKFSTRNEIRTPTENDKELQWAETTTATTK